MCTVSVKVNENLLRGLRPELTTTAAIRRWAQEELDRRIEAMVQEEDYYNYEKWDITKTEGYKAAMDDVANGRVYHAASVEDMMSQILE